MKGLRTLVCLSILGLFSSSAIAGTIPNSIPKIATPTILPAGEALGYFGGPSAAAAAGIPVYQALAVGATFLATSTISPVDGLPYDEYGDDCHLTDAAPLTGFSMGYFKPGAGTVDALITFYTNNPTNTVIGAVVAGPYLVTGLPSGLNLVIITPPDSPFIPTDIWFAVQFSPDTAGLVAAGGPPTVGTSEDIFVDTGLFTPPPGLVFFGGSPVANFMIAIDADVPVPVEATSWGNIKSKYESSPK